MNMSRFTAHLTPGHRDPVKGDSIYNGAGDNASGTSALLEMARAFFRVTSRSAALASFYCSHWGRRGLLGSDYYAQNSTVPITQIVANITWTSFLSLRLQDIVPLGGEPLEPRSGRR